MRWFSFRAGGQCLFALLLAMHSVGPVYAQSPGDTAFVTSVGALCSASFDQKGKIVEQIAQSGHPSTQPVLAAFLEDRVYCRNQDQKVFLIKPGLEDAPAVNLIDPLTLKDAGSASADDVTRVVTNNHLRRVLQTMLARFGLSSSDASVRLEAVKDIERDLNEGNVQLLRERISQETNSKVKKEIALGLALSDLDGSDPRARLAAIATLQGSLRQDALNKLQTLVEKSHDGTFTESDEHVRRAAAAAIKSIESERSFYSGVQTILFGLSMGSILVLIAIGLGITFGVMGVINMAHGELMMLGAYATYVVQMAMPGYIGSSVLVAVPVAFLVSGLTGVLIERTIIRFLYGRPLETLLATFGVSLILQQLVRTVFTALNREVKTPDWMSGTLQLNEALSITYNRLYILIFTLLVFAALLMVLKKTRIGLEIRAVAQNRAMAKAMGIRSEWVDAITFGLGSGIAGVAGVALSQVTNVNANLGQSYIIDAFMVVVFGGVGSLWGAMVAGLLMGVVDQLLQPYAGAVLAKIFVLIALILFIQARPRGLFPATGRAAESQ
ncbi:MAG: urea ABC transporter permease subunit UrtB [Candidatus Sulfotelmatobacter sp.]